MFTLVLATNTPGRILKALTNRAIQLQFQAYSNRELRAIALHIAKQEGIQISPQAARLIAEAAQGTPRRVFQRVQILRLFAPKAAEYTLRLVRECLASEGIDSYGLTIVQRSYLRILAAVPKQQCVLEHLAVRIGLDARFVREEIEYFLAENGYIEIRSNNARRLTQKGNELLQN